MTSKNDVETYLQSFVAVYQTNKGWEWCVDKAGCFGQGQYSSLEVDDSGLVFMRGEGIRSWEKALRAGLDYLWAFRQDLVAIAQNEAIEAAKYQARERAARAS
ncbi:hypothetical protein QOZ63_24690 [Pseudomonas aeruginosa]|uniref:hypothetical protein n=1 Tax=Pseudomonas aeruginosa TaxID=287 RepID=UPI00071BF069|nr:hypothetical protein [Pseudomonas aeruginosa]EKX5765259.1 hypothetical protein [Pseudomonas aeruginosa]KSR07178.1 hypothetical protein APB35_27010 [Pseudomonas aeruginosa]MDG4457132.1 hypothetical protein [Pseudomonas aeruginosa]NJC76535.1 hypothetical protein [Pseudomonas aeruginosa]HBP0498633.1 hypothetical protein [Pseudomonas aeruginosa]